MKKIFILTSGVILGTFFVSSCQQKASNEQIDAKVTELYNEQKVAIENQASIACDSAVNAQVTMIQDSLSHLNAKQQAALLEKTQRELAIAKKKAIAKKPPVVSKPKVGTGTVTKPVDQKTQIKNAQDELFKSGGSSDKSKEEIKKSQDELFKSGGTTDKSKEEIKNAQDDLFKSGGK